jgi:nitrate/nitrite transporter NarK
MMIAAASAGSAITLGLSAVLLGVGYGATAPTSSHLLMKRTPQPIRNLVFSIRQVGVPLGGVLSGLIVPPLVLAFSWQMAIGAQLIPIVIALLLLQLVRSTYDADRNPGYSLQAAGVTGPLRLARTMPALRVLALVCFFYAGVQLCFIAYMSVHLTSRADFGLIQAGQMLAAYQIAGVVSRPIWGVIADRWISARTMLIAMGFVMAAMAVLAGRFSPEWPHWAILIVAIVAGATASGYTGLAFAEFARIGGNEHAAEATGLGAFAQMGGVMVLPTLFSLIVSIADYNIAYNAVALLATLSAIYLARSAIASRHNQTNC